MLNLLPAIASFTAALNFLAHSLRMPRHLREYFSSLRSWAQINSALEIVGVKSWHRKNGFRQSGSSLGRTVPLLCKNLARAVANERFIVGVSTSCQLQLAKSLLLSSENEGKHRWGVAEFSSHGNNDQRGDHGIRCKYGRI